MCRLVAYLGEPILAEDLITKPKNSLIHQSYHAREMAEPLKDSPLRLIPELKYYIFRLSEKYDYP